MSRSRTDPSMAADVQPDPPFGDRLASAVARRESAVVVGLDPDPSRLWPGGDPPSSGDPDPAQRAGAAVADHCRRVLDAVAPACVAVKLQSASFERLGAAGQQALAATTAHAASLDLLVLLDAKRGDIDVSAASYAQAAFGVTDTPWGPVAGLGADAVTVAPYMGRDSLLPFVTEAAARGRGTFVLVRTSNPGAADLQEQPLADGQPLWARVARMVAELGADPAAGPRGATLDPVGAVVGATAPERIAGLRELMPRTPFLLPGVGAQGGRVEDLAPAFAPGPGAALVTASRSIVGAGAASGEDPATAARRAAEALRETGAHL
ncbi:orotidine-5'-phosphate decarboxylase [Patulibacter defluvii]|uniref:orotidine-5'-phosphate decarboxylase n=1 Tax=Patulibacter defluvii TaxID=3095358 RepID=UPI002A75241B|nr:orotidine-5'-phosphate decarboxylase [Patulibacter sp. DM4]